MGSSFGMPRILLEADFTGFPGDDPPDRAYEEITSRVLSVQIKRGRNKQLERFEAGTMKVELANKDGFMQIDETDRPYMNRNLLTAAQSSYEGSSPAGISSGASFFTVSGGILSQNLDEKWTRYGFGSIKFSAGLDDRGWHTNPGFALGSGLTYTFSAWLRGEGGGENVDLCLGSAAVGSATQTVELTDIWERYSVTLTTTGAGTAIVAVRQNGAGALVWFADGLMVEAGSTPSEYVERTPAGKAASLKPGRRVRFSAFHSTTGDHYHQFAGFAEGWPPLKKHGIRFDSLGLEASDAFTPLASYKFNMNRPQERSDVRIGVILNTLLSFPTEDVDLGIGQQNVIAFNYQKANGLSAVQDVADAEQGQLYVGRTGKVVFENRYKRSSNYQTSLATFGEGTDLPYEDIEVTFDWNSVLNDVQVEREGGPDVTVGETDSDSIAQYLQRVYTKTLLLVSDTEAEAVAQYILARHKDVEIRVDSIVLDPTSNSNVETHILARDISDRITVKFRVGGVTYTGQYHIEAVSHNIQPGKSWRTTWQLSPASLWQFWVLDDTVNSRLGSTTRVGY